uniref:Uncharacterized protein n=1 Tax=Arundo donax TaxID=35708 RepID=A0A0A9F3S8_ARUDO
MAYASLGGSLGINCLEMTGDSEFYNNKAIHNADSLFFLCRS